MKNKNIYYQAAKQISKNYISRPDREHFACNTIDWVTNYTGTHKEDFTDLFTPTPKEVKGMKKEGLIEKNCIIDLDDLSSSAFFSSQGNYYYGLDIIKEYDHNCRVFALLLMHEMTTNP